MATSDRGRETEPKWGWVVVASTHVVFVLWVGFLKTIGVLLPALTDVYETNTWVLGWIVNLVSAANNIAAVFGSVLSSLIGGRQVVILGGGMAASGLLLASVSASLPEFAVALIVLTGCGFGIVTCICKAYLGIYFDERLVLASSIATMGVPVGLVCFPAFAELLFRTYDIQGTLLILGGLTAHLAVCGLLLRPRLGVCSPSHGNINGYTPLNGSDLGKQPHALGLLKAHVMELFDVKLLKNLDMWMLMIMFTCFSYVNDSWLTFMVSNAMCKGFGGFVATSFSVIAGSFAVVFSVLQSIIIYRGSASIRVVSAVAATIGSIALFLNPFLNSYVAMAVAVAMYGVALAVLNPAIICLVIETQGRDRAVKALGWMGLSSGIVKVLFGFVTGLFYDLTGSYNATFILLGALYAVIIPTLFMDSLVQKFGDLVRSYRGVTFGQLN